ncbi:MAG: response regulator transcription factor [Spirochaetaceae bacterium]
MELHKLNIVIVEDEENLRHSLEYTFNKEGYNVAVFPNGKVALENIKEKIPDLIISDIMMPLLDGLELCKEVRKFNQQIPFIFLTSRDDEFDRILGLEIGADDYLCKPFSLRELTTRVKVLFRRVNRNKVDDSKNIKSGNLSLNPNSYTGDLDGKNITLTVSEFRLLESLMETPGNVKTREQLIKAAYPHDSYISDRNIDCHIKRVRKKITLLDPEFNRIKTVYGLGYKLEL